MINWEWSWSHAGKTALDAIGLIPVIGSVKNADEVASIVNGFAKHGDDALDSGKQIAKHGDQLVEGAGKLNAKGQPYPSVTDPRTGKNITMPEGDLKIVPKDQRVEWNNMTRGDYIKEWYDRGYQTPKGGWEKYDIHHMLPREYGGANDFENLVPVERTIH